MSIYDFKVAKRKEGELDLADLRGKVLLIVNTATGCGFTPQYEGLEKLYEKYQLQAQKQGRKTAELIRNAMQDYADLHFKSKNKLKDLDFSRTVSLKAGASDFLTDSAWKEDFTSGRINL